MECRCFAVSTEEVVKAGWIPQKLKSSDPIISFLFVVFCFFFVSFILASAVTSSCTRTFQDRCTFSHSGVGFLPEPLSVPAGQTGGGNTFFFFMREGFQRSLSPVNGEVEICVYLHIPVPAFHRECVATSSEFELSTLLLYDFEVNHYTHRPRGRPTAYEMKTDNAAQPAQTAVKMANAG